MKSLNREVILSNVTEAREELEKMEALLRSDEELTEGELFVMFGHAFHHLNFAWNARRVADEDYRGLTNKDFNEWGRFPTDIEPYTAAEAD
jgi:hypothetical protein